MPLTFSRILKSILVTMLVCWLGTAVAAADEPFPQLKMSGFIEAGASDYLLTGGFANRHSEFVRGELRTTQGERWSAEVDEITEFGSTGTLLVANYEKQIGDNWITQTSVATSTGGDTLPRLRLDMALSYKWLEQRNLVSTLSITELKAKDVHRDHAIQLSSAYFFDVNGWPWAVEAGIRRNQSDPGANGATSYFTAVTSGREKERIVSLRLGAGREAYQLVGNTIAINKFPSNTLLLTWREWLTKESGFQLRADVYHNPFYNRRGIEASWFWGF